VIFVDSPKLHAICVPAIIYLANGDMGSSLRGSWAIGSPRASRGAGRSIRAKAVNLPNTKLSNSAP